MSEKNNSFGENEYVSIFIALVGLMTLTFYQIVTNSLNLDYLYIFVYIFCGIFLIRLIDLSIRRIFADIGIAGSFSISWLTIIFLSVALGFIGIKISFLFLISLAAACIVLTSYFNLFCRLNGRKFIVIFALAFTLSISMSILSLPNSMPWLSEISKAGLGYHDTFRDAAIANIWSNYGVVSHGIHGLLKEP